MAGALICGNKDCQHEMLLPYATNRDPRNSYWPANRKQFSFLCPSCKQAYVYNIDDVCDVPAAIAPDDEGRPGKVLNVFRLAVPCSEEGCKGHLEMRTLLPFDCRDPWQEFQNFLKEGEGAFANQISCGRDDRHVLTGRIRYSGPRDYAGVDELWS
jgi:hypothetical protein